MKLKSANNKLNIGEITYCCLIIQNLRNHRETQNIERESVKSESKKCLRLKYPCQLTVSAVHSHFRVVK